MRIRSKHELQKWLAKEIWNRDIGRKPPAKERKGPQRDSEYKAWIRQQPSIVSGQYGCEAAHIGSDGGMSMKASDYSCVPLTPAEHREYHRGRLTFARRHGVDLAREAARLYAAWQAERAGAA